MQLQKEIFPIQPEDIPQVITVWETSVRATHYFVNEADIQFFKPIVQDALYQLQETACIRDHYGLVAGFIAVENKHVNMLFISPMARGKGVGKKLLYYAVNTFGATTLDVNEQNEQAVGFYRHMGFEVIGRSELDDTGKPYPILHMKLSKLIE
jgi:putative acetyltransferase